jgi:hypothetical protein
MIADEFTHVEGLFRDIVDARIDGTPIDPLLARAQSRNTLEHLGYKGDGTLSRRAILATR